MSGVFYFKVGKRWNVQVTLKGSVAICTKDKKTINNTVWLLIRNLILSQILNELKFRKRLKAKQEILQDVILIKCFQSNGYIKKYGIIIDRWYHFLTL